MPNDSRFLEVIKESFEAYLIVGTSRSTAKLRVLHGQIARDLQGAFGPEYTIQSQGYGKDKEGALSGRYYPKNVDIVVSLREKPIAGYAVKFVMRNYSQNSNNYFENMLGETANLRANGIPYFQIFILFDKVPYYKAGGPFQRWDIITKHNLDKYIEMSADDPEVFCHTPDKTLIALLTLKEEPNQSFKSDRDYADYYRGIINENDLITHSNKIGDVFSDAVILNDYESFIAQSARIAKSKID